MRSACLVSLRSILVLGVLAALPPAVSAQGPAGGGCCPSVKQCCKPSSGPECPAWCRWLCRLWCNTVCNGSASCQKQCGAGCGTGCGKGS